MAKSGPFAESQKKSSWASRARFWRTGISGRRDPGTGPTPPSCPPPPIDIPAREAAGGRRRALGATAPPGLGPGETDTHSERLLRCFGQKILRRNEASTRAGDLSVSECSPSHAAAASPSARSGSRNGRPCSDPGASGGPRCPEIMLRKRGVGDRKSARTGFPGKTVSCAPCWTRAVMGAPSRSGWEDRPQTRSAGGKR